MALGHRSLPGHSRTGEARGKKRRWSKGARATAPGRLCQRDPALTRGALGLNGPPLQGPFAQYHVAAAPPDLEDAPEQNRIGGLLEVLRGLRPRRGQGCHPRGHLFFLAALQGAHPALASPPGHDGAVGWARVWGPGRPLEKEKEASAATVLAASGAATVTARPAETQE